MAMNMDAMLRIKADVQGENNIRRLGNSMQGLQGQVKNTSMAVAGLGTAFKGLGAALAVGGFSAAIKGAIDLADDMRDLSQRTGVGIETLGQFKIAAELSGTSIEGVAKGLTLLNKNMVAAATAGGPAAAAFKTLAVSTTETDGTLRKADKVFLDVADRFAELRDGPEKAALAMKIFGKSGAELIPVLNLGSEEIQRFGLGIGPDFADKADAFNDSLGIMKAQVTVLTVQIGSALLPVLSGLVTVVGQAVTFIGNLAAEFYEAIGGAAGLQRIAADLIKTMVVLGGVTAGVFLATNITTFATALRGVLGVMRTMLTLERAMLAVESARVAVAGVIAGIKSGKTPATAAIGGLIGGGAAVTAIIAGVGKLVDDLTKRIGTGLQDAFKMPNIPNAPTGTTPDLSGLQTGKAPKAAEKITKMSKEELEARDAIRQADLEDNTLLKAKAEYLLEMLELDKQKLDVNARINLEREAATKLIKSDAAAAAEIGSSIAQDFLKRQELQENYNRTIEDLQIKTGEITGDKLKQIEIDREVASILERLPGLTQTQVDKIKGLVTASKEVKDSFKDTFSDSLKQYFDELKNFGGQVGAAVKGAFQGLEDQLTSFVTTGKANFRDLANSIISDIARIAIRQAIIKPLVGGIGDLFKLPGFAMGGVLAQNGIQKFARGGIIDKPTVFPFANGIGLMGEAGPEAIMPLRRGRDGRLGVEAANGGGGVNVTVNVDAQGTSVQGDNGRAGDLGRAISEAVKNEIVAQKRPGGLLA